jgi:hypothetical protein
MSIRIMNSRGVPGTLACLARTVHQRRPVFLTSCHMLFAAGAARNEQVWQVLESSGHHRYRRLGCALQGKRGIVRYRGDDYFVDCGIGALEATLESEPVWVPGSPAVPKPGDRVMKTGAATGTTTGVIVDSSYCSSTNAGASATSVGRDLTPRQLLIRSTDPQRPFAEAGDSGALVVNEDNIAIGLLWGMTVAAESVACPIDPVLHALNIQLCGTSA